MMLHRFADYLLQSQELYRNPYNLRIADKRLLWYNIFKIVAVNTATSTKGAEKSKIFHFTMLHRISHNL